jgi:hypothetical protein
MEPIKGNVAKIIDEYTVILNIGFKSKVEEGMRFIIYSEGEEIIDPVSGKNLGKFENIKAKVKVVSVAENYSTAKSDEYQTIGGIETVTASMIAALAYNKREINKGLPLDDETKRSIVKYEKDEVVHARDLVRQIIS